MRDRDKAVQIIRLKATHCRTRELTAAENSDWMSAIQWRERRHALLEAALELETTDWRVV